MRPMSTITWQCYNKTTMLHAIKWEQKWKDYKSVTWKLEQNTSTELSDFAFWCRLQSPSDDICVVHTLCQHPPTYTCTQINSYYATCSLQLSSSIFLDNLLSEKFNCQYVYNVCMSNVCMTKRTKSSYCRAMCMLELLMLKCVCSGWRFFYRRHSCSFS